MTATPILHADLDAFYASVEQREDPTLRDRPMAVGSGVILAASYEARARGVRTAMSVTRAEAACPGLVIVPPRMEAYSAASREVYAIFEDTAPLVEGISIDEAFLDVSGLERISGGPVEIATGLRTRVREQVGLAISVGIARTKFLAKVASGAAKPDGLLVVEPEAEAEFLHPRPIESLWGVGRVTAERLRSLGIRTVGEIAAFPESRLTAALGDSAGKRLHALANLHDPREVRPREPRKSIGAQSAFPGGSKSDAEVDALLASLVDRAAGRLRDSGKTSGTVSVGLRFDDMSRASRSRSLEAPTSVTDRLLATARGLLVALREDADGRPITLVGVSLERLEDDDSIQLQLDLAEGATQDQGPALDGALDELRSRFGSDAVTRASLVDQEGSTAAPILPD